MCDKDLQPLFLWRRSFLQTPEKPIILIHIQEVAGSKPAAPTILNPHSKWSAGLILSVDHISP